MEVNYYAKAKHWCIGGYLSIVKNVIKGKNVPFNYIDLFSGDGLCVCDDPIRQEWESPPMYVLDQMDGAGCPTRFFFNDLDAEKLDALRLRVQKKHPAANAVFLNEDANVVFPEIAKRIRPDHYNLVYLDPYSHYALPWSTIESLCDFSVPWTFKGTPFTRRPELLVVLMTNTMQRWCKDHPDYVDRALGTTAWRRVLDDHVSRGIPAYVAFLDVFKEKLAKYYDPEREIFSLAVRQVRNRTLMYYVVFASTHPTGAEVFRKYEAYARRYMGDDLMKEYVGLEAEGVARKHRTLDRFL